MSADKRSLATDAMETLGQILSEHERRDAIHLAVDNVVAAHPLRPGEDVGFLGDGTVGLSDAPVGIVDPFLKGPVMKGERFWLVVYPRTITSLRHVWTHPAFDDSPPEPSVPVAPESPAAASARKWLGAASARKWLEVYALRLGASYEELMRHAEDYLDRGEYWNEESRFCGEDVPEKFWDQYELATGKVADGPRRGSFFSCSC